MIERTLNEKISMSWRCFMTTDTIMGDLTDSQNSSLPSAPESTLERGGSLTVRESRTLSLTGMRHADERLSSILSSDSGIRVRGPNCPTRDRRLNVVPQASLFKSHPVQPFVSSCSLAHRQTSLSSSSVSKSQGTCLAGVFVKAVKRLLFAFWVVL